MGVFGAGPETTGRLLDRMEAHIDCSGGLRAERHEAGDLGLLRFHHGTVNPGPQPVSSGDGALSLAMDGELYNQTELRRYLAARGAAPPEDGGDAVLVLALYECERGSAFERLSGSFSLAIHEPDAGRLLLVTDRLFSRPIFYCRMGTALVFSSRFNALAACGALDGGQLNMTSVMQMFTFQHSQYTSTHYREAQAMRSGSVLRFEDGRVSEHRYWRPQYGGRTGREADFAEELAGALRAAAARCSSGTARAGLMLSGGLDARAVVAAAPEPMTAFTMGDAVNREVRIARRIAHARGWPHVFVQRGPDHYAHMMDEALELTGGMGRFDHCHFLGQLSTVRERCDAVLVEEQMDVLLKGYYWERNWFVNGVQVATPLEKRFGAADIEDQIINLDAKTLAPSRPWMLFREPWRSRYREIMRATVREQLADGGPSNPYHMVEHVGGFAGMGRTGAFANITCVRPWLEYRSVCFDADLIDLGLSLPAHCRMGARVFLDALKRLDPVIFSIPYANTGMRPATPGWLAWAARVGSEAGRRALRRIGLGRKGSAESWPDRGEMLRGARLRTILQQTLWDEACLPPAVFDIDRLKELFEEHMSRRRHHMRMLLCLLSFGRWFRKYGPAQVA
jgi:asparagine synthase (glutamine-hydrolysing)